MTYELKQLLETLKEVREHSLKAGSNLILPAYDLYLKWFYWCASFAEVFDDTEWGSYTTGFYLESLRITEASLVLSIHGEYKPAIQVLRDWLEGTVSGYYFDLYPEEGKRWEEGGQVDFGKSSKGIKKKNALDEALMTKIGRLWGDLSGYVHQKEAFGDFVSSGGQPLATYNEESLRAWEAFFRRTFGICSAVLVSKYPVLLVTEKAEMILGYEPAGNLSP